MSRPIARPAALRQKATHDRAVLANANMRWSTLTEGSMTSAISIQLKPSQATPLIVPRSWIWFLNELLSKAGAPNGAGERIMLYSPGQLRDILAITQASSSDFTKNQIHDRGTINGVAWEGFNWIEIADVMDPSVSVLQRMLALASTTRSCVAMGRGAVGLSIGKEINTKINERADLNNSIQVRSVMMMAAGRVWEGGVVQVDALEN